MPPENDTLDFDVKLNEYDMIDVDYYIDLAYQQRALWFAGLLKQVKNAILSTYNDVCAKLSLPNSQSAH